MAAIQGLAEAEERCYMRFARNENKSGDGRQQPDILVSQYAHYEHIAE
jgi:hypothetical protein